MGFRKPEVPREQLVLWAKRLDDALPDDHPARLLDWLLHSEAFEPVFADWRMEYVLVEGKPPYHPRDMAALYLYGFFNGLRSSRQLEAACWNRLDVMWLMSGQHPDHSTVADFVKRHHPRLRQMSRKVMEVGIRAGLVKLQHVAVDGTKIEANAGKGSIHRRKTFEDQLQQVDAQIAALEAEWAANEAREAAYANLWGERDAYSEATSAERQERLTRQRVKLEKALDAIRRREAEAGTEIKPIGTLTDPDSRVMPGKDGVNRPNYNAQTAVDAQTSFVVADDVNDQPEDSGQMVPMLKQVEDNCGRLPAEVSADSQYNTGHDLAQAESLGVETYLPDNNRRQVPADNSLEAQAVAAVRAGQVLTDAQWAALPRSRKLISGTVFQYDPQRECYRCPMGQTLEFLRTSSGQTRCGVVRRKQYGGCTACAACPRASSCCQDPAKGRTITRDEFEPFRERLRARMASAHGRERYILRRQTVEPRFGQIKSLLGVRRFLRRGLAGVRAEFNLVCMAVNLGILLKHWQQVVSALG
jgi:transposase